MANLYCVFNPLGGWGVFLCGVVSVRVSCGVLLFLLGCSPAFFCSLGIVAGLLCLCSVCLGSRSRMGSCLGFRLLWVVLFLRVKFLGLFLCSFRMLVPVF